MEWRGLAEWRKRCSFTELLCWKCFRCWRAVWRLCLLVSQRMSKLDFEDTDYSVVVKNRAPLPNSWRWEIYRAGRASPIGQSAIFFHTMAAANKEGKAALKQLLAEFNV